MDKSLRYFLGVLLVLSSVFFTGEIFAQNQQSQNLDNLDGLEEIPEWLMVEVEDALPAEGLNIWVPTGSFETSSLIRVPRFPESSRDIQNIDAKEGLTLNGVRNEQLSAQLAVSATDTLTNLQVTGGDFKSEDGAVIEAENMQVRFVKYLPVHKAYTGIDYEEVDAEGVSGFGGPDVVADPLVEAAEVGVPAYRAQPIWFTLQIPEDSRPGKYEGTIQVRSDQYQTVSLDVQLTVRDYRIPDPKNNSFDLDVWLNPFAVAEYYNVETWSNEHWDILDDYLDNLALWGQTKIMTTVIDRPWKKPWLNNKLRSQTDVGFESMVEWQLLPSGEWNFDYSIFDKYVEFALKHGNGPYIDAQSMLVFRGDQRITYYDSEAGQTVVEKVNVQDERYKEVWTIFLKDFRDHLIEKGWFDQIQLGFDERPLELMNRVTSIIREAAPEFEDRIYLSGHQLDEEVSDLNIGYSALQENKDNSQYLEKLNQRIEEGKPTRFYMTCCSGAHPNRFSYSPAIESWQIPWISLKFNLDGYADWAYNCWPRNVFESPVFNYPQGDEYFVYPGQSGPMSSIRWELIKEGIEDFELIKKLEASEKINDNIINRAIEAAMRSTDQKKENPQNMLDAREILFQIQK